MFRRLMIVAVMFLAVPAWAEDVLPGAKKVVFLGDSITHAGQYVTFFETQWRLKEPMRKVEVLNLGLPSETASGLSEVGHAGGKFPRPDLHERLQRVLSKTQPDTIIACYGMNDGIYLPLDDARFQKYKDGLIRLGEEAAKVNAKVIFLTPAVFDPLPIKGRLASAEKADASHPFEGYGAVLDRYSDWLIEQRKKGWTVIDVHGATNSALAQQRKEKADFRFAGDGVHPNFEGHLVMGAELCRGLGLKVDDAALKDFKDPASKSNALFKLVDQRSRVLRDSWLTHTGHKRPMGPGLPLDQAQKKADEITAKIQSLQNP